MPAYGESAHKMSRESAARLRILRLSFGYETAASFARATGYRPGTYRRYERRFPMQCGPFRKLFDAIRRIGPVSFDWLLDGDPANQPRSNSGSNVVIFTQRKAAS